MTEMLINPCSSSACVWRYLPKITHRKPIQPSVRLSAYMECQSMSTSVGWLPPSPCRSRLKLSLFLAHSDGNNGQILLNKTEVRGWTHVIGRWL